MYVSFIEIDNYSLYTYSFHKLQSAFLFGALSITISDWSSVLYDINEYKFYPFLIRKFTLLCMNFVYFSSSLLNFFLCFTISKLNNYLSSPFYVLAIFIEIGWSILLTCFMLNAGLKLYHRISGAAGNVENTQYNSNPSLSNSSSLINPTISGSFSNSFSFKSPNDVNVTDSNQRPSYLANPSIVSVNLDDLPSTTVINANNNVYNNNDKSIETTLNILHKDLEEGSSFNSATNSARSSFRISELLNYIPFIRSTPTTTSYNSTTGTNEQKKSSTFLSIFSKNSNANSPQKKNPTPLKKKPTQNINGTSEFQSALHNLNMVMLTCTICILIQMLFLMLNYALGYSDSTDKTVGPPLFYW